MQSAVNNRGKDGAALVQKTAQLKLTELHNVLLCHAVLYCTVLYYTHVLLDAHLLRNIRLI